ncbi:histidine--tRNA ligase [Oligella urethralis]|uniref:histidine--tRNA ligase n=1 Tax=Oligella urethralis TaxID=90245 RepID=UPI000367106A|nr:histidine--tRNA ligase [Oligella urethralis]AVL70799.1 histidine--tRNA ligase [Oligella urethralis]PMC16741.1 histidine--tRNA ligase [Oligella urethralis]SUA58850.1 Histidine--tRNA ligase [Oligella urethralis]SUA67519.1 Histidine--tRNA ligase [Oligella urethralis]
MSKTFNKVHAIRGMNDILPNESYKWEQLENIIKSLLAQYGYQNIRTPILEQTRLFARGIGEVTDIVEKEMYTFTMKKDADKVDPEDMLTMRPEFTAGVVRAAIEHNLLYERPLRAYAMGQVFRHERPQKGRYRQFHQLSVEAMGFDGPDMDVEIILLLARLWRKLKLTNIRLELNCLGQSAERAQHREALIAYLEKHVAILDEDAKRRMYSNPLRVLDTKNPAMQEMANNAPKLFDYLGAESKAHFEAVCERLQQAGIDYVINPRLVRGLDYYNLTVFEWVTDALGAQGTVCGGGRYDGLFELLGGKATPCVGFGLGLERLLELADEQGVFESPQETEIYFVHQGEKASQVAALLAEKCRDAGWKVMVHAGSSGFKSQFKRADLSGARWAVVIGEEELAQNKVALKPLRATENGTIEHQFEVPQADLVQVLAERK